MQTYRSTRKLALRFVALFVACLALAVALGALAGAHSSHWIIQEMRQQDDERWVVLIVGSLGGLVMAGWAYLKFVSGLLLVLLTASVEGTIEASEVRSVYDDGHDVYFIHSRVRYTVDDRVYVNAERHDVESTDKAEIRAKLPTYAKGCRATVFYDPRDPDHMSLLAQRASGRGEIAAGLLELAGASLLFFFIGVNL